MPAIIPLIAAGIGAATTGVELANQPGGGNQNAAAQQQAQQAAQTAAQQQKTQQTEAILAAAPSVQERLGGAVSPDFFAQEAADVSGNPDQAALAKQILNLPQLQGLGSTSTEGATSPGTFGGNTNPFAAPSSGSSGSSQGGFFESLLHNFNLGEPQSGGFTGESL